MDIYEKRGGKRSNKKSPPKCTLKERSWEERLQKLSLHQLRQQVATKLNKKYEQLEDSKDFVASAVCEINHRIIDLHGEVVRPFLQAYYAANQGKKQKSKGSKAPKEIDIYSFTKKQFIEYQGATFETYEFQGKRLLRALGLQNGKMFSDCKEDYHYGDCKCREARKTVKTAKLPQLMKVFTRSELLFTIDELIKKSQQE